MRDNESITGKDISHNLPEKDLFGDGWWRVKAFELDIENNWNNLGTGMVTILQEVFYLPHLRMITITFT